MDVFKASFTAVCETARPGVVQGTGRPTLHCSSGSLFCLYAPGFHKDMFLILVKTICFPNFHMAYVLLYQVPRKKILNCSKRFPCDHFYIANLIFSYFLHFLTCPQPAHLALNNSLGKMWLSSPYFCLLFCLVTKYYFSFNLWQSSLSQIAYHKRW